MKDADASANGPPCGGLPPTSESTQSQSTQILQIASDLLEILKKIPRVAATDGIGGAQVNQADSNTAKMRNSKERNSLSAELNQMANGIEEPKSRASNIFQDVRNGVGIPAEEDQDANRLGKRVAPDAAAGGEDGRNEEVAVPARK